MLNDRFQVVRRWTGADGAYSVPINSQKTLWTFGDTWIGEIRNNQRLNTTMINNSVALQKTADPLAPLSFHWGKTVQEPRSLWVTNEGGSFFWPGDGAMVNGKLYIFLHKIKPDRSQPEPFQFRSVNDVLLCVENPEDEIELWRSSYQDMGNDPNVLQFATACLLHGHYIYIYCSHPKARKGLDSHPAILARILKDDLAAGRFHTIEYLCCAEPASSNESGSGDSVHASSGTSAWLRELRNPFILFPDAAPEMSVTTISGIRGFVAVYMPPLSKEIFLRHAPAPEGPWSERIKIYDCPEKDKSVLLYSAKAHQELTRAPRELIVTYCRNSSEFKTHLENASLYFPRTIRVLLNKPR